MILYGKCSHKLGHQAQNKESTKLNRNIITTARYHYYPYRQLVYLRHKLMMHEQLDVNMYNNNSKIQRNSKMLSKAVIPG